MGIAKEKLAKIVAQAIEERQHARIFRQGKVLNWQKNELMYYGRYTKLQEARSSVHLGGMSEFVHTLLSKIDNPLLFKYVKRKNSQVRRVERLNALRQIDAQNDDWDFKDLLGKKQAIIYGRAIYSYYADSSSGTYTPHLEPIDVYDYLIDPACGGLDIEEARYMGSFSVVLDKKQLKDGAADGLYIKSAVKQLLDGNGNAGELTMEQTNKRFRTYDQLTTTRKEIEDESKYRFWRWHTTFREDGLRYYLLMNNAGECIRAELWKDLDSSNLWPYWTWAAFPDLTEFWTPSYADYVREILMAKDVTINQALDNSEAINKPQKAVNVSVVQNLAELKYRRDGLIKFTGDPATTRVQDVMQVVAPPPIDTPLKVYDILDQIQQTASGVTNAAKGVADESGKVGIYEGNEAAMADRFGLLNKSYSNGYKRFAKLYQNGVRNHLIKKIAISMIGPDGIEFSQEIKRSDIFRKGDDFNVMVEASNAQILASNRDKTAKLNFLEAQANNTNVNQKKSFEIQASIAGFDPDEIKELLDVNAYGTDEIISDCDQDIEELLDGDLRPNQEANNAYMQHMLDYVREHNKRGQLSQEQFDRFVAYMNDLQPIVLRNEAMNLRRDVTNSMMAQTNMQAKPIAPGAPPIAGTTDAAIPNEPIQQP